MVSFNEIPDPNRSPAVFAEFDPQGIPGKQLAHVLLVGIRLSTGSAAALSRQSIIGETQGDGLFGEGAQLAGMCRAFKSLNRNARVTAIGVSEPSSGTAASGKFAITGPATADGVLAVFVAGERVAIAVTSADTATEVATALAAAINANAQLPVTASADTGDVTCTCRWKGVDGNAIDLAINLDDGDALPAGIGVTVTAMASGAGQPAMADVIAAWEETRYDTIVSGFADDTSLDALEAEVRDRWTATRMLDGIVMVGARGTVAELDTLGAARNAPESLIIGAGKSPSAPWIWAAQTAAADASLDHPGLPRSGLLLPDVRPPATADRLTHANRNLLLESGISTHRVDAGGQVVLDRLVTTYQKDALGEVSETWRPLSRRRVAAFLRRDWVARVAAKYGRMMLADDGTNVDPGVPVITPSVLKGEALAWFRERERRGYVQDFAAFKESILSERHDGDDERVDMLLEPNLIRELVTIAVKFAFV